MKKTGLVFLLLLIQGILNLQSNFTQYTEDTLNTSTAYTVLSVKASSYNVFAIIANSTHFQLVTCYWPNAF